MYTGMWGNLTFLWLEKLGTWKVMLRGAFQELELDRQQNPRETYAGVWRIFPISFSVVACGQIAEIFQTW